jgi:hypothetical protein
LGDGAWVELEFGDAVGLDVLVDSMDLFELPGKGVDVARELEPLSSFDLEAVGSAIPLYRRAGGFATVGIVYYSGGKARSLE